MFGNTIDILSHYPTLIDELNQQEAQQQYRYLLIDMLGTVSELSELYLDSLKDNLDESLIAVIKRPEIAHQPQSCPHLICIGLPNQALNEELLAVSLLQYQDDLLTTKYYVCGWLISELAPQELAEFLLQSLKQIGHLLKIPFLPLYEPLRTEVLQNCQPKNKKWLGIFLPNKSTYYFIDSQYSLQSFNHQPDIDRDFVLSAVLAECNIGYYQMVLSQLLHIYLLWLDLCHQQNRPVKSTALAEVMNYLHYAQLIGLTHIKDQTTYVLFSLQYGDLTRSQLLKKTIQTVITSAAGQLNDYFKKVNNEFTYLATLKDKQINEMIE